MNGMGEGGNGEPKIKSRMPEAAPQAEVDEAARQAQAEAATLDQIAEILKEETSIAEDLDIKTREDIGRWFEARAKDPRPTPGKQQFLPRPSTLRAMLKSDQVLAQALHERNEKAFERGAPVPDAHPTGIESAAATGAPPKVDAKPKIQPEGVGVHDVREWLRSGERSPSGEQLYPHERARQRALERASKDKDFFWQNALERLGFAKTLYQKGEAQENAWPLSRRLKYAGVILALTLAVYSGAIPAAFGFETIRSGIASILTAVGTSGLTSMLAYLDRRRRNYDEGSSEGYAELVLTITLIAILYLGGYTDKFARNFF